MRKIWHCDLATLVDDGWPSSMSRRSMNYQAAHQLKEIDAQAFNINHPTDAEYKEINRWLDTEMRGRVLYIHDKSGTIIIFEKERDAALFKRFWKD